MILERFGSRRSADAISSVGLVVRSQHICQASASVCTTLSNEAIHLEVEFVLCCTAKLRQSTTEQSVIRGPVDLEHLQKWSDRQRLQPKALSAIRWLGSHLRQKTYIVETNGWTSSPTSSSPAPKVNKRGKEGVGFGIPSFQAPIGTSIER